jgi:hypothetical protein
MTRLADLISSAEKVSLDDFVATWPDPLLLHPDHNETGPISGFQTQAVDTTASRIETRLGLATSPALQVTFLRKRPGGLFPDRVSVGRTRTNDVMLNLSNLSKFHAYFTWDPETETCQLTDANSTNGTFLNGERLKPRETVTLVDRALVGFAQHHFRFHLPGKLYKLLRAMLAR